MLEVCIDSLESAINAIHGGADELEVCSCLSVGGLTPSVGLVEKILHLVSNIGTKKSIHKSCPDCCRCLKLNRRPKINIMVRCSDSADFVYNDLEIDTMLADIEVFKNMAIDRFVFGALDSNREIDEDNCVKIIKKSEPFPVTFHRAFDCCIHPKESLEKIIKCGFTRLLTSGQAESLNNPDAYKLIEMINKLYGDKIEVMPGAGLSKDNAKMYFDLGCKILHGSCTGGTKVTKEMYVAEIKAILAS